MGRRCLIFPSRYETPGALSFHATPWCGSFRCRHMTAILSERVHSNFLGSWIYPSKARASYGHALGFHLHFQIFFDSRCSTFSAVILFTPASTSTMSTMSTTSTTSTTSTVTGSWLDLPAEIRNQILDIIVENDSGLAVLAAVSREWQDRIEPHNFARITITPSRLSHSDTTILRRKSSLIHYIWFSLNLEYYNYELHPYNSQVENVNSLRIKVAFQRFFTALSSWPSGSNLVLDISIHSPYDTDHRHKFLGYGPETRHTPCSDFHQYEEPSAWPTIDGAGDGRAAGFQDTEANITTSSNISDTTAANGSSGERVLERRWWRRLPLLPAVKGILLRSQTRRQWNPSFLADLLTRFPNIRGLGYEPWRETNATPPPNFERKSIVTASVLEVYG